MHRWLANAFFRLHRRRQFGQHGYQPLNYQEMADFAERIQRVHPDQLDLFYLTMEETDNGILYDQAKKSEAEFEAADKRNPRNPKKPSRKK